MRRLRCSELFGFLFFLGLEIKILVFFILLKLFFVFIFVCRRIIRKARWLSFMFV